MPRPLSGLGFGVPGTGSSAAGRGAALKSNALAIEPAERSREASGATPQLSSMNFSIEVKSSVEWSMKLRRAYGLMSTVGTRKP